MSMSMDETISRYQPALSRLLALVLVTIGVADDTRDTKDAAARAFRMLAGPEMISRRVHRMVRTLLFPLEAATRRLIIALAASLPDPKLTKAELKPQVPRPGPKRKSAWRTHTPGVMVPRFVFATAKPEPKPPVRMPRFALLDPQKRFFRKRSVKQKATPSIRFLDDPRPRKPVPQTIPGQFSDSRLMRRVAALANALDDLPKQARRFARWRARCNRKLTLRRSAMRLGPPPGSPPLKMPSRDHRDEHELLAELHSLAYYSPRLDTS